MTASTYPVLAWSTRGLQTGTLVDRDLDLTTVPGDLPLEDIRNCSCARDRPWGAATGVNRHTGRQELWRFDLDGTRSETVVAVDYILHNAIDPTGEYICYTAPPSQTRADMSLYGVAIGSSHLELIVDTSVSRFCCPSWRPSSRKAVYHTVDNQVVEVDTRTKSRVVLFSGEHPTVSPDGVEIAYREGDAIRIWHADARMSKDVPAQRGLGNGQIQGGMSWSPDGKYLLIGRSGGVLGYELAFYRIDVNTGKRVRVRQRHLQGLRFR